MEAVVSGSVSGMYGYVSSMNQGMKVVVSGRGSGSSVVKAMVV